MKIAAVTGEQALSDERITAVILAGGLGRRMGRVDKGLQLLDGKPLVQWVLERLAPQADEVLLNANQNTARYEAFGYPVIGDQIAGFAGPLAGLHAALTRATHPLVAAVPCDSPFLPTDLLARLRTAITRTGADVVTARTFDQAQPVFCLCRRDLLPRLTAFLAAGGRQPGPWYQTLAAIEVAFDDQAEAFRNINTEDDLASLRRL